jgi:hypothetical protein
VLLLFEEITQNKYDDLSNAIAWRDTYLESLSRKALNSSGQCIAFIKTIDKFRLKLKKGFPGDPLASHIK